MTALGSMTLNDRGCFLLSQGCVSEGLEMFKKALSALKSEVQDHEDDLNLSFEKPQKAIYRDCEATADDFCCWLVPVAAPISSKNRQEPFWIYSCPLCIQGQGVPDGTAAAVRSFASDAFTVSLNVALASHLRAVEQVMDGDCDEASHSFLVAMKMYNLTLRQANNVDAAMFFNSRNDHVYAAIFNNLTHVHAMLGEPSHSLAHAEQLLGTLFYLLDSGRVVSAREAKAHSLFLQNAHFLLMAPSSSAAAA